jgi:hypothetical protein
MPVEIIFEYTYIMSMIAIATRRAAFLATLMLASLIGWAPARTAELVMFERAGCPWCARWDAEVAPSYGKTPEGKLAPLRRHNVDRGQPKDIALERPVRYTPTFVLVDEGKEVARITGYMDNAMFWGTLMPLFAKLKTTGGAARQPEASQEKSK